METLLEKKGKKLLSGALVLVACLVMAGCEGGANPTQTQSGPDIASPQGPSTSTGAGPSRPSTVGPVAQSTPAPSPTMTVSVPTPVFGYPDLPCGPYMSAFVNRHFLYWTPEGEYLIFDDGTTISTVDAEGHYLQTLVDVNLGDPPKYGFHADVSPEVVPKN